jgi:hypothetical protein
MVTYQQHTAWDCPVCDGLLHEGIENCTDLCGVGLPSRMRMLRKRTNNQQTAQQQRATSEP